MGGLSSAPQWPGSSPGGGGNPQLAAVFEGAAVAGYARVAGGGHKVKEPILVGGG